MDVNEINKLGASKYFEDQGAYRNPYPHNTYEFDEFERGWTQSLKRDNGRLASDNNRPYSSYGDGFSKKSADTTSSIALSAERYRSRKG